VNKLKKKKKKKEKKRKEKKKELVYFEDVGTKEVVEYYMAGHAIITCRYEVVVVDMIGH
jgi:hypothetical protein